MNLLTQIKQLTLVIFLSSLGTACTPNIHPSGSIISSGQVLTDFFITNDGAKLPLKTWQPSEQDIKFVIIALHGFNDYSNFFQKPGEYFSQHKAISYAYDQRGFGKTANRGLWAGLDTYTADLKCFIQLIKNKHPQLPVFLLGEIIGGAIVISTMAMSEQLPVAGIILAAPAVWARQTMPWYQNTLLWTLSHTVPWLTLTGNDLGIKPSDNIKMLIALGADPLVIKETRVESIYGLVNLMDMALVSAERITSPTLLLYGEKDEIIPQQPTYQFLNDLTNTANNNHTIAFYKNGYHMLLRDLQAPILWADIKSWIFSFATPLPSGADKRAKELVFD